MPSPFPGMDPYIEVPRLWPDFHNRLASEISALLNASIQPRYVARMNPYVVYETLDIGVLGEPPLRQARGIRPDVGVLAPAASEPHQANGGPAIAPAPVISRVPIEVALELSGVEVRLVADDRLVTAIEILSPVNKRPGHTARSDYLTKRQDLLHTPVHFLEIDLLRGGERTPLEAPVPRTSYYVTLARADRRPYVEVWPIAIDAPLPVVPVPLLAPDSDVALPLGELVHLAYDRGAYAPTIDYRQAPPPPLVDDEVRRVDACLRGAGLR